MLEESLGRLSCLSLHTLGCVDVRMSVCVCLPVFLLFNCVRLCVA